MEKATEGKSRVRTLTKSEQQAEAVLQSLRMLGLVRPAPYDSVEYGEIKRTKIETFLDSQERPKAEEIRERKMVFNWEYSDLKVTLTLRRNFTYFFDNISSSSNAAGDKEEDLLWWECVAIEVEDSERNNQGNKEVGKIVFDSKTAVKMLESATRHRPLYPYIF